jgi:hypothetical protein
MYNMEISIFGYTVNLEILILIGIVYIILVGHTICGCCNVSGIIETMTGMNKTESSSKKDKKEGFTGANTNYGESSIYSLNNYDSVDASKWGQQSLAIYRGKSYSPAVKEVLDRKAQPTPLPEGELDMFANTPFKPECCPNTYSNSTGCACMTVNQYSYLTSRGGNNVPYSEY